MIRHSVVFKLKHKKGSAEEASFLEEAKALAEIAVVQRFECLKEISPKNDFEYGLSMEFVDQAAYDEYNTHPDHVAFVNDRWLSEVEAFLEIDYAL